jgi:hypothetical protein
MNPNLQSWDYQPVHNIYLLILAELGIIGFILWLIPVLFLTKKSSFICSLLFIVILAISLFDHYFWTLYFGILLFWLTLGLMQKKLDNFLDKS